MTDFTELADLALGNDEEVAAAVARARSALRRLPDRTATQLIHFLAYIRQVGVDERKSDKRSRTKRTTRPKKRPSAPPNDHALVEHIRKWWSSVGTRNDWKRNRVLELHQDPDLMKSRCGRTVAQLALRAWKGNERHEHQEDVVVRGFPILEEQPETDFDDERRDESVGARLDWLERGDEDLDYRCEDYDR